ncbi:MAG: low molecular weight phosphotyrosine protein phosphatase [Rhodoferax sp.]|jgi:protein-tyrosine phosphatase|nr:low molecular weight phosphotyrosine protein phosphatase [Rhodoferax sp.]
MTKILLVCMANVCRSPMARLVLQQLASQFAPALELEIDSAGTHVKNHGKRPDDRVVSVLSSRGYKVGKSRSRQVRNDDFERFDLILAMDFANLETLTRRCPAVHCHKLNLFLSFAPETGVTEIPDPYFGNLAGFERVLDLCEAGARGIITKVAYTR